MTQRNAGILRAGLALVLAFLYDVIFYKKGLGINFPVFVGVALTGFTILTLITKEFRNRWAWLLGLPIIALAISPALYTNEFSAYAAPILALLGLIVLFMILTIKTNGLPFYLSQLALPRHFDGLVSNWKNIYQDLFSWREGQAKRVVWGLIIAFPLLIIFATMLADADPIFSEWLENLNIWEGIWRVFRTIVLTLIVAAFFYLLASEKNALQEKVTKIFKMNAVTVGVVLALLNALFALFVYIQIKYLFGGATYLLANDITLADYARNGFFELVRVVGMAAVLIIFVQRSFSHHGSHWFVNLLQVVFIGQVGIVAASALRRMALYQDSYGFTALRLYVEWFIYALIFALVFSGIALLFKMTFRRFFQSMLAAALAVSALVSLINVDYVIARENIGRFLTDDKKTLDMHYISSLSRDAAPAFSDLVKAENFEKLTISQKLTFDSTLSRFAEENTSSTVFAYTWSQKKSQDFLNSVPDTQKTSVKLAKEKDKQYEITGMEIQNVRIGYNRETCISTILITSAGGIGRDGQCVNLFQDDSQKIQAQLITEYHPEKSNALPNKQKYVYAVVQYDLATNVPKILYTEELPAINKDGDDGNPRENYILEKSGSIIQSDFTNRDYYEYVLSAKDGYRLEDKKLF